jgi:hypothetical protein
VVITKACADLFSFFEAPIRCYGLDTRRFKRIFFGEIKLTDIESAFIRAVFKTKDAEVPLKHVCIVGHSHKVG